MVERQRVSPVRLDEPYQGRLIAVYAVVAKQVDGRRLGEPLDVQMTVTPTEQRLQVGQGEPAGDQCDRIAGTLGNPTQEAAQQGIFDLAESPGVLAFLALDTFQSVEHQKVASAGQAALCAAGAADRRPWPEARRTEIPRSSERPDPGRHRHRVPGRSSRRTDGQAVSAGRAVQPRREIAPRSRSCRLRPGRPGR